MVIWSFSPLSDDGLGLRAGEGCTSLRVPLQSAFVMVAASLAGSDQLLEPSLGEGVHAPRGHLHRTVSR